VINTNTQMPESEGISFHNSNLTILNDTGVSV